MSEPVKLSIEEILGIPIETEHGFYCADDPAYLEMRRKADALDKLEKMAIAADLRIVEDDGFVVDVLIDPFGKVYSPSLLEAIEKASKQ